IWASRATLVIPNRAASPVRNLLLESRVRLASFISILMRQLAADFLQRRPPRFFQRHRARALPFVQILAAVWAQSLAILAARDLQRDGQQNLLAHYIVEQNPLTFIIADLSLGVGHRNLVPSGVRALRTV